jgi:hypothetical protein
MLPGLLHGEWAVRAVSFLLAAVQFVVRVALQRGELVSRHASFAAAPDGLGNAVLVGAMPATGTYMDAEGDPNLFKDPTQAMKAFRAAYAGESGQRNNIYGPGYFGIDGGISKAWHLAEGHDLKFSWEVFNTTNSVRFDGGTATTFALDAGPSFGKYSQTVSNKRVMQFALRYEF